MDLTLWLTSENNAPRRFRARFGSGAGNVAHFFVSTVLAPSVTLQTGLIDRVLIYMTLDQYQNASRVTMKSTGDKERDRVHVYGGLAGEAGELLDVVLDVAYVSAKASALCELAKKSARDGVVIDKIRFKKEAGDLLWYFARACDDVDVSMEDIAIENIEKILSRKRRGVLAGSGDNR